MLYTFRIDSYLPQGTSREDLRIIINQQYKKDKFFDIVLKVVFRARDTVSDAL